MELLTAAEFPAGSLPCIRPGNEFTENNGFSKRENTISAELRNNRPHTGLYLEAARNMRSLNLYHCIEFVI
ncbi:hypothetical protein H2241_22505 [Pantoea ananatis]|uniref:hypothetical protein n=1 Tax=Pantoea ananas TaxID=553 RepID=UPI00158D1104|nr:hypothetical protein [Pantoea ananatis]MBA4823707.1 hypothetical protein [Pantoea ananatis]QKV86115.1 hypothetical protein FOB88_02835 [Pantoea ananatis]